jgi:hypothetical protein
VNAPLVLNQVVVAEDSIGTNSEPAIVLQLTYVYLPYVQQ